MNANLFINKVRKSVTMMEFISLMLLLPLHGGGDVHIHAYDNEHEFYRSWGGSDNENVLVDNRKKYGLYSYSYSI